MFVMLICCLSAMAQSVTDNIYIYRNDGKFNAFTAGEVESLAYSKKDLNGVEHPDVVVQEIWTADSVYRIPLAVIDSVSVVTPEVKYAPKVKKLSPDYLPYIKSTGDMSITFSNELPHSLRVNKGDILVYEDFDNLFENGFAGRVASMNSTDNSIEVTCEAVELTDIYEENISVGYYTVEQDTQSPGRYRLAPISRGFTPLAVPIDINLRLDNGLDIQGNGEVAFDVKVVTCIRKPKTYIEMLFTNTTSLEANLGGALSAERKTTRDMPPFFLIPSIIIPNTPLAMNLNMSLFGDASLKGKLGLKARYESKQSFTVVYDDGRIQTQRNPHSSDWSLGGSLELKGDLFCGVQIRPGISTIGNLASIDVAIKAGPHFEFDANPGVTSVYNNLKNSTYSLSTRLGIEVEHREKFFNREGTLIGSRYFDVSKTKYNVVPEFQDLEVESDSRSITVKATAVNDLLIPCEVGFRLLDEDGEIVDYFYSNERKVISTPELKYGHTFSSNLKSGKKYVVRPLVRLLGAVEVEACPEKECYLDCNISTGTSSAAMNSFEMSGALESELPSNVEVGFVYTSERVKPTIENAKSFKATFIDPKVFKGSTSGLREGTTYYYCAYAHYNDIYYYGDVQCVTTKRGIDIVDEDNPGGGSSPNYKAYVSTGYSNDVETNTAKIGLTFNAVSPTTECGYYLQADSKRGKTLSAKYCSLGTVTGNQTVELTDLIPGTKYTYWAKSKNTAGESEGQKRTFKTEPSPDPVSKILDITDISMQKATVKCYYDNFKDAKECGIIYDDGEFSYKQRTHPESDGVATITLKKLAAETKYTVTPYVELYEGEEAFKGESEILETLGPDITGWWIFNDGQGEDGGRIHDLEIRPNGRTNNFYGVNSLSWERNGRKITMRWSSITGSNSYWEYRGTFNESYTKVTGEAVYVFDFEPTNTYDEMIRSTFYLIKK